MVWYGIVFASFPLFLRFSNAVNHHPGGFSGEEVARVVVVAGSETEI